MNVEPIDCWIDSALVLEGVQVRLDPLEESQAQELFDIACDEEIWRYLVFDAPQTVGDMRQFIDAAEQERKVGAAVPFVIRDRGTGSAIGSTRYLDISAADHTLSVGWTWLGRKWWRSGANIESKYLLLKHAFETAGAIRVQIKADERNTRSLRAIEQLGAVREGVIRQHMIAKGGFRRSSVIYSILDFEWPTVRQGLELRMRQSIKASEGATRQRTAY